MTTVAQTIISARYDLKDENSTQYGDDLLLDFFNRGLRQLEKFLASVHSDWLFASEDLTLSEDDSSVSLPSDFLLPKEMWIGTSKVHKTDWNSIKYTQRMNSNAGQPTRYALQGTTAIFDYAADDDYTVECLYYKKVSDLASTEAMPFNGVFDDPLRQATILIAKNKDEYDVSGDAALHDFFMGECVANAHIRTYTPKRARLNF